MMMAQRIEHLVPVVTLVLSSSSVLLQKKAKAEVAKARLFAEKEPKLKREQLGREARVQKQKTEFAERALADAGAE